MEIKDIKNTKEGKQMVINYLQYLQDGNERVTPEFATAILNIILSVPSLVAFKELIEGVQKRLGTDVVSSKKSPEQADDELQKARDLILKHCLITELKFNVMKESGDVKHTFEKLFS